MPDLTIQYLRWCASNESWDIQIPGSNGKTYNVHYGTLPQGRAYVFGYSCDCDAFKYGKGKECKHIKAAIPKHCLWNHEAVCGSGEEAPSINRCPSCGGELTTLSIGC